MSARQEHGVTAYANGTCRCARICRPAWRAYIRDRRRTQSGVRVARRTRSTAKAEYYMGKEPPVAVAFTRLGKQILQQAERLAGENMDDLMERAVRKLGVQGLIDAAA